MSEKSVSLQKVLERIESLESRFKKIEKKLSKESESDLEVELVNRKLDKLNQDIKEGKSRLLGPEEALGKYAKLLKR